jgi:predicted nucleic acid-binding protein
MILVVDASAVAAMVFEEAEAAAIRAHIRGETVVAPQLIDYEIANVCCKRMQRYPDRRLHTLTMLSSLERVAMTRLPVEATAVARLAANTGLSANDAAYLWLAMSRDAELITLDKRLAQVNEQLRGS